MHSSARHAFQNAGARLATRCGVTRHGGAGQAFKLDESDVTDGTTANLFAVSYRMPRQDD